MNKVLMKNIMIFTVGAATGAVSALFLVKKKYEKIANDEISAVKERFKGMMADLEKVTEEEREIRDRMKKEEPPVKPESNEPTMEYYAKVLRNTYELFGCGR